MDEKTTNTANQLVYSEFVNAFRSYKKRKSEWQAKMQVKLAQEEEEIRRKRESLYTEFV